MAAVKTYAADILKGGVMACMRSTMMGCRLPDGPPDICGLFAAATIGEAFYMAAEIDPQNKFVQQVTRDGIEGGLYKDNRITTAPMINWLEKEANLCTPLGH